MLLDPFRAPSTGAVELLACRAPDDAWHSVALWPPGNRESQNAEAAVPAGVKTTAPPQPGVLRPPSRVNVAHLLGRTRDNRSASS
jgi:hypothetical protein